MKLANDVRSLWSGVKVILAGSDRTTVVICPTAKLPAEVGVDPANRLESCSRWPGLGDCLQACMPQVEFSAEGLEDFTARHEGKKCTSCGEVLTREHWYTSRLTALARKTTTADLSESLTGCFHEDSSPI
jgi:hypothetical protein